MLPGRENFRRHVNGVAAILDRGDRRAGGDAAHHRDCDRLSAVVLGSGADDAAEASLDHVRRETFPDPETRRDRLRQFQHFERACAIGQAADEAALFQGGNQPVDARLGAKVQRFLHFLEGGRHARFLQPLMDEFQEIVLFLREHLGTRWPGIDENKPRTFVTVLVVFRKVLCRTYPLRTSRRICAISSSTRGTLAARSNDSSSRRNSSDLVES